MINEKLFCLAVIIAIIVVLCIAVTFAITFALYSAARTRCINGGLEDAEIIQDLKRKYFGREASGATLTDEERETVRSSLAKKSKRSKIGKMVGNVVFAVFMVIIVAITIVAVVFRAQGGQFFFGDTAYLVVRTDSMSYKSESNPYYEYLPDNQIEVYSLISINKLDDDDEIEVFDIIAYTYDGTTYVHRVVNINTFEDGTVTYQAMGDTNIGSFSFELCLSRESILGIYTGNAQFVNGVLLLYLQSNIGIISLVFAFLFLLAADICIGRIDACVQKRIEYLLGITEGAEPPDSDGAAEY